MNAPLTPMPEPPVIPPAPLPEPLPLASAFRRQPGLGSGLAVAILVKYQKSGEALVAHRRSFIEANKASRFAPLLLPLRESSWGGGFAAVATLGEGPLDALPCRWRLEGEEVRGLDTRGEMTVVAMVNRLLLVETASGRPLRTIDNPRFRNLHSVAFHPSDPHRALLSNSGLDEILEISLGSGETLWRWHAWNHGYHRNPYGLELVDAAAPLPRGPGVVVLDEAEAMARMGAEAPIPPGARWVVPVDLDNVTHPLGLAKWQKGAEPNWAGYHPADPDRMVASLFVANQAVSLSRGNPTPTVHLSRLSRPHGFLPWAGGFAVSDTRKGRVVLLDPGGQPREVVDFSTLPLPHHRAQEDGEWLQHTCPLGDGALLASVDSRRCQLVVWDPRQRVYDLHPYDCAWSLHAVQAFPPSTP